MVSIEVSMVEGANKKFFIFEHLDRTEEER